MIEAATKQAHRSVRQAPPSVAVTPKRILTLVTSLAYFGMLAVFRMVLVAIGRRPVRPPVVLTYHGVNLVDVPGFERQMKHLARRAEPIFPDVSPHTSARRAVAVTFDDGFQSVFDHALPILTKYRIPATVFVPTGCLGTEPEWIRANTDRRGAAGRVVSARTLQLLDNSRVRLGSHTVTHPRLSDLDRADVESELSRSRETLEALTNAPVKMLSLPYGSCTAGVVAAASRMGYQYVFANVPLRHKVMATSPLVGRIDVSPGDWPLEFCLKSSGAYGWLALAIPAKRAVLSVFR